MLNIFFSLKMLILGHVLYSSNESTGSINNEKMKKTKRVRGRPEHQAELNHEDVFKLASVMFAAKGFDGVKLTDIAAELGVVKSLMHYHFHSKENLWFKTVEWLREKLFEHTQKVSSYFKDLEGVALLKAINRQYIYFAAEFPEFHKIISHETTMHSERTEWLIENILKPLHFIVQQAASDKKNKKIIKDIPLPNFMGIVIGSGNIYFAQSIPTQVQYGINVFDKKEIEKHADIVNDIIFHGILKE